MFDKFMKNYGIFAIIVLLIGTAFVGGFYAGSFTTEKIYTDAPSRETATQAKTSAPPPAYEDAPVQDEPVIEEQPEEVIVTATAYCSCKKCCGKWAENRPNGIVYTASGTVAKAGRTIAVDPSVFPIGTVLEIDGVEYVAEDTGSAIKGYKIDIYVDDHETAMDFGVRELTAIVKEVQA